MDTLPASARRRSRGGLTRIAARLSRNSPLRSYLAAGTLLALALVIPPAAAQQGVSAAGGAQSVVAGGAGAAANADFDSLIDLITSTVDRDSWMENGTGAGEIMEYANGVYVDAAGSLRMKPSAASQPQLDRVAAAARNPLADSTAAHRTDDARVASELRFVSLPRLEQAILQRSRERKPLDSSMLTLAGLRSVRYVAVNPKTHEILLAGPAGDWRAEQGALVAADTGSPVVRLDDLLTLWRRRAERGKTTFGCSIVPRQAALARTQEFLAQTSTRPLAAGGRGAWLAGLRDSLGEQDVVFYNLDSSTRVARILLLADYHMKLVGMGIADGVPGVRSYLATVKLGTDGQPPAMSVIRWWFALKQCEIAATTQRTTFALPDACVQVLSENELLAARGERVHTGQADDLTSGFARSFTAEFDQLAAKYPVYAELGRIFELALVLAVVESEDLCARAEWQPRLFVASDQLGLPQVATPKTVETVVNHRIIARRHVIAGVSGGVWLDPVRQVSVVQSAKPADARIEKLVDAAPSRPKRQQASWWWDAEPSPSRQASASDAAQGR